MRYIVKCINPGFENCEVFVNANKTHEFIPEIEFRDIVDQFISSIKGLDFELNNKTSFKVTLIDADSMQDSDRKAFILQIGEIEPLLFVAEKSYPLDEAVRDYYAVEKN